MNITCYTSFSKKSNSTKLPTGAGTVVAVTLKNPTSVINPVFILTGYNLSYNYILWGSRYYYVDDIIIVHNDVAEYHCSIDVLATYKTQIGSSAQYVTRSSDEYNLDIIDAKYPTTPNVSITRTDLTDISNHISVSSGTYVIGIKSKEANAGVAFYCMDNTQFGAFVDFLYSDLWMDATDITSSLQKILIDPFDYVVSCNWYPFSISGDSTSVYFGFWDWTGTNMDRIPEGSRTKSFMHSGYLTEHPQSARGRYLNRSPFTQLELFAYAFGKVVLDPNKFPYDGTGKRPFIVNILVDLFTGIGTLKVQGLNGKVYETSATCSIPVQLSQVRTDLVRPVMSLAGTAVSLGTHNYLGAAASLTDAVMSGLPQISTIGAVGSISAYAFNMPQLFETHYPIVAEDLTQIGRPLCQVKTISSLPGYIECEKPDLDLNASPAEKDKILNYMETGFYYE